MSITAASVSVCEQSLSRRDAIKWGAAAFAAAALGPLPAHGAATKPRVVVWSEGTAPDDKVYPQDINTAIAAGLKKLLAGWTVETATLADPDQGASEGSLQSCDVLIWWGHKRHDDVKDAVVDRIMKRVKEGGMGFIPIHSSHYAKANRRLMGTECSWGAYENDGCKLKVIVAEPNNPIARGVKDFTLPQVERYSEPYAVPTPESVPFRGTYLYPNGKEEPARVGLCWTIGKGRVFYFAPGHETYRDFYMDEVQRILANAVEWAGRKA
jgi:trehalose utilization protein